MKYFQIRISEHSCLDMVLQQISKEVWLKIRDFFPNDDTADYYFRLRRAITRGVNLRVRKFPNCGLTEECHDAVEGGPWVDYNDKIYMLSPVDNFERFIGDVANQTLNSIADDLSAEKRSEIFLLILATLNHELSKYLYFNPVCRDIPFCYLQL